VIIDFPRYLNAKYDLDLRSLNHSVLNNFSSNMEKFGPSIQILELGGGIGSMLTYLLGDKAKTKHEYRYTLIDSTRENITFIPKNIKMRSEEKGFHFEVLENKNYQISNGESIWQLKTICTTTEDFLQGWNEEPVFEIVLAASYLDIVPVQETLRLLEKVVKKPACLYLPFNYDGLTTFHPTLDRHLDEEIISLYNLSMDNRMVGGIQTGGSQTGRKLLDWLPEAGYEITCAGSSDWCLLPSKSNYSGDESYFLECILQFVEESVTPLWKNRPKFLEDWLATRRRQVAEGKLSYLAHQLDFLALR
jgi:hypothetical protein